MKALWEGKPFREVLDMAIAAEDDSDMYILSGVAAGVAMKEGGYNLYIERIWNAGHMTEPDAAKQLRQVLSEVRSKLEGK